MWTLGGLLMGGVVGGLLAGLPQLARAELSVRLGAVADRTGAEIHIGRMEVGLLGAIELEDLRLVAPPGAGAVVTADRVTTRLHVEALLAGVRRLSEVRAEGLVVALDALPVDREAALAEVRRRLDVVRRARRGSDEPGPSSSGGLRGMKVTVLGAQLRVGERVVVGDVRGSVERGADGGVVAGAEGRIEGGAVRIDAALKGGAASGELSFEPALPVAGAPALLGGVSIDEDGTVSLRGLRLGPVEREGVRVEVECDRAILRRGAGDSLREATVELLEPRIEAALPVGRDGLLGWAKALAREHRPSAGAAGGTTAVIATQGEGGAAGAAGAAGGATPEGSDEFPQATPLDVRVTGGTVRVTGPRAELLASVSAMDASLTRAGEVSGEATVEVDGVPPLRAALGVTLDGLAPRIVRAAVMGAPLGRLLRERRGLRLLTGEGTADVELRWQRGWSYPEGAITVHALTIADKRISPVPVVFDGLTVGVKVARDRTKDTATLTLDVAAGQGGHGQIVLAGRHLDDKPLYDLSIDIPKQDCAAVVASVPAGMLPSLAEDLRVQGTLEGHIELLDLDPTYFPRLRLVTEGGWEDCRITRLPEDVEKRLKRIGRPFKLEVDEGDGPIGVFVGPKVPGYVSLGAMPPLLRAGPLLTEDGAHYVHQGFSRHALEGALRLDLTKRRYVYGGSSLSQQLVKNLFLHRDKTLARKLEEAVIVVAMERALGKDRILELYHNCIEYGARLYGIGNAARHYFGKGVADLVPVEIAFLMHLKTTPKEAFMLAKRGSLPQRWRDAIAYRMRNFVKKGYITQDVYDASAPFDPIAVKYPSARAGAATP